MNADGASGAGCSQRPAGTAGRSTDTDQSALRHQRGGDNPNSGAGGLPSPGTQTLISGSGHGIRVLSRSHTTDSEESLDFFGVAHKGSALKVSRGSNLSVSGANIHMRGCAPSGSGKAKPVAPIKRFTVLQDNTPAFHCGRLRSGGDRVHSSHTDPNTKVSRCKRSLYTPGLRKEHPGQASGSGRLSHPTPSGTANASPGVPALPGTPIMKCFADPGGNGRFGLDHPPAAVPPVQRSTIEKITIDGAAEQQRAPSHLAFHLPKAQNAARSAAATPGLITAQNPAETDTTSSNLTSQNLHQTQSGLITRLAHAFVSKVPFMRASPCTTPPEVSAGETTGEITSEKGTTPSGFTIPKGRYPGQFLNFGPGLTAASTAAGEPTTGNDQHVPDPRAKDAGNPLSSATQNLHTSHDESAGDNPRPDFSVPPENPKITPAKTPVAGTSAGTGSGAQNSLESATPHATPVSVLCYAMLC